MYVCPGDQPRMVDEPDQSHSSLKWRERAAEPQTEKPARQISVMEKYPAILHDDTDPEGQYEFYEEVFR